MFNTINDLFKGDVGHAADFWLGGHDQVYEGQWTWAYSGAPLNYTAWIPGEPGGGTAENCLYFHYHRDADYNTWNDFDCDDTVWMRPICKAPFKAS